MIKVILVCAATSADLFAVAAGLRAAGIKLPFISAAAVSVTGAIMLWLSSLIASAAFDFIPLEMLIFISRIILGIMGVRIILGDYFADRGGKKEGCLTFSRAMSDPSSVDSDCSKGISLREAVAMGTALSADSVLTGISAGSAGLPHIPILVFSVISGLIAVFAGIAAGGILSRKCRIKFPAERIGGIILIILAIML